MGVMSRLGNLVRSMFGMMVVNAERDNPEAVYTAVINERIEQHQRLMKAVSGIVYLRNKLEKDLNEKTKELSEVTAQLPVAVASNEEAAALLLIERKNVLTSEVEYIQRELSTISAQAEEAKKGLVTFQNEIEKLKHERDTMLAKREHAHARLKIQEQLSGLSLDADIQALDTVRDSIHKLEAQADTAKELQAGGMSAKLLEIKTKTASQAARAELEEMKRQQQFLLTDGNPEKTM